MARYISKARAFKKSIRKAEIEDDGFRLREVTQPVIARFKQGGATPREVELARQRFVFKGLAEGENPWQRISVFDTDEEAQRNGWSPEDQAEFEAVLDSTQNALYFKVEAAPTALPWPAYDDCAANDVLATARLIGVDLKQVLAFERENRGRAKVLQQVEKAVEHEVVVAA